MARLPEMIIPENGHMKKNAPAGLGVSRGIGRVIGFRQRGMLRNYD
jgi:hypothetical protein